MQNRSSISKLSWFFVVLSFLFLVSGSYYLTGNIAHAEGKTISPESKKLLGSFSNALAEVAEAVRPAVVNISTTTTIPAEANPFGDMFNDPFFRRFFGDQFSPPGFNRKQKTSALGSGVIVSDTGYILQQPRGHVPTISRWSFIRGNSTARSSAPIPNGSCRRKSMPRTCRPCQAILHAEGR
jgi:hypothetical protein